MRPSANAAPALWSSTQFWVALPVILIVLLFGAVALTAIIRARKEDVPSVLSIIGSVIGRLERRPSDSLELAVVRRPDVILSASEMHPEKGGESLNHEGRLEQ